MNKYFSSAIVIKNSLIWIHGLNKSLKELCLQEVVE
nr:MAG TPA: hypothetical protein [Caudoviricetes sp.]